MMPMTVKGDDTQCWARKHAPSREESHFWVMQMDEQQKCFVMDVMRRGTSKPAMILHRKENYCQTICDHSRSMRRLRLIWVRRLAIFACYIIQHTTQIEILSLSRVSIVSTAALIRIGATTGSPCCSLCSWLRDDTAKTTTKALVSDLSAINRAGPSTLW